MQTKVQKALANIYEKLINTHETMKPILGKKIFFSDKDA